MPHQQHIGEGEGKKLRGAFEQLGWLGGLHEKMVGYHVVQLVPDLLSFAWYVCGKGERK